MISFSLLDEPWLPVRWCDGKPPSLVGLRNALIKAHEIAELATDNPLETISLNRLLAALTASIFPELAEQENWMTVWWDIKQFDADRCNTYLDTHAAHFDLLSATRPFYGHPKTDAKEVSPPSRLQHAATSGNNALLFSHDLDNAPQSLTLAEAARALVCTQAAALGGGVAQPFNLCHGPLVGGAFFWLRGTVQGNTSLFRALLLNLAPTDKVWGNVEKDKDAATWVSKDAPQALKGRQVHGIRGLFTLQSRRLQLVPDSDQKAIVGVRYNQGSKMELLFHDPHLAYRQGKEGEFALRFSTEKTLWQDSSIYMMNGQQPGHAPRTFEWVSNQLELLDMARHEALSADVFGLVNDQAKIELWRHERVTIYPSIINDASRWITLQNMLDSPASPADDARKVVIRLREAVKAFASRVRLNKPWGIRLGDVERSERDQFVQMLDAESRYWQALSSVFDTYLGEVATLPVQNESLPDLLLRWQEALRKTAFNALNSALESFAQDARTWQALSEAQTLLTEGTLYPKTQKLDLV